MTNTMTISEVLAANTEKLTKKLNTRINKTLSLMAKNVDSSRKLHGRNNDVVPGFIGYAGDMGMLPKNKCVALTKVEIIERADSALPVMFKVTIDKIANDKGTSGMLPIINSKKHDGKALSYMEEHLAKGDLGFQAQTSVIGDNAFYMLGFDIDSHGYNNDDTQYVAMIYFPPEDIVMTRGGKINKRIKANTPEWFKKKFAAM